MPEPAPKKPDYTWLILLILAYALLSGGGLGGVTSGPREILIVREADDTNPAYARLLTDLRTGETAKYLTDKKHILTILDKDGKDENGTPAPILDKYKPFVTPEMFIFSQPDKLLLRQKQPDTKEAFLEAVKAKGG